MEKEGWIERIEKGKYLIIPFGARKGGYTINEFIIGSQLVKPAVIAYWSALNYHGFTEQIPNTVFIQTTARKKEQQLEIFGVGYRIIRITEKKLFGFEKVWIDDVAVQITQPEKTVMDCLDKPQYCGGITEAAKALHGDLNVEKLKKICNRYRQFCGHKKTRDTLRQNGNKSRCQARLISGNYPLLDPSMHGNGILNRKWKIRENVSGESGGIE